VIRTVLVTGASGFIGSHLAEALTAAGYTVRAMTRHPATYHGAGEPVAGDVTDPDSLTQAMAGVDAAYYLVHSLDSDDFETRDATAARNFAAAAARAGLQQIVYLGGLGADSAHLSPHLRSRREVERILAEGPVPVTTLRAAVVIGHGGISWEITRQLVDHLPAVITPKWVGTRTQPIALRDAIRYLVGVLDRPEAYGRAYEIGGPEALTYAAMLQRAAAVRGKSLPNLTVPVLTPQLSSLWLSLVTDVNTQVARTLVDSLSTEVVVHDRSIEEIVPGPTFSYEDSVRVALADREAAEAAKAVDTARDQARRADAAAARAQREAQLAVDRADRARRAAAAALRAAEDTTTGSRAETAG
jgi:uncharacterized protein YbjT (DUF2867 family)